MKSFCFKLYVSWLVLVGLAGTIGALTCVVWTIHDSSIATNAIRKLNATDTFKDYQLDPNGNISHTIFTIEKLLDADWESLFAKLLAEKTIQHTGWSDPVIPESELNKNPKMVALKASGFGVEVLQQTKRSIVSIRGLWRDITYIDSASLIVSFVWVVGTLIVLGLSVAIKHWVVWLFRTSQTTHSINTP